MEELVRELLSQLGEDPAGDGLRETPRRVAKSLRFLTSGYKVDLSTIVNNALFDVEYSEMVIVRDIDFYSLCEHHLLPFFGKCHVAYLPSKKVIVSIAVFPPPLRGLSTAPKIATSSTRSTQKLSGYT